MSDAPNYWRCEECHVVTLEAELLSAPSPFDPEDVLIGCPACRGVHGEALLMLLCQVEGCGRRATSGAPTHVGYRRLCYDHFTERAIKPERRALRRED